MSRLARSSKDRHHLLELCGRYRVLLADADGVHDPADHSDRLLLGLHGVMNEAEPHVLKQRTYQGRLNKARRGGLPTAPPIGYVRLAAGEWAIDPDEQARAVARLIFDQFDREATMHGLLRYPAHHQVRIPVRAAGGPGKGQPEWRRPNRATLQNLLRHPGYAGAYRFGHRPTGPRKKQPGRPATGKLIRRPEGCLVLIRDRLPAYITWDRFEANRARLTANRQLPATPGAVRNGPAVLAGLVRCGRCGRRRAVRHAGPGGRPSYARTRGPADYAEPPCRALSYGAALDELAAGQLLAAVEPAALEAGPAAVAGVGRGRAALAKQWRLRRERAAYEVDRAARQYQACEPERRWEDALKARRQLDDEYDRWQRGAPARLSDAAVSPIRALAADLPAVWAAAATTPADRRRAARLLLEKVVVTAGRAGERVDVALRWVGGAARPHVLLRPVGRYRDRSDYPRLVERPRRLCADRLTSAAIAGRLNAEGFRPPRRAGRFTGATAQRLTSGLGLARRGRHGSAAGLGPDEYRPVGRARRLGASRDTVRGRVRRGWVRTRADADGRHVTWADADELRRLGQLPGVRPRWANRERLAALRRPKPRPQPSAKRQA